MHPRIFLFLIVNLVTSASALSAEPRWKRGDHLAGEVHRVLDGDTIEMLDRDMTVHVRLGGIDAPEDAQQCADEQGAAFPCGRVATRKLFELVRGREVPCPSRRLHGICLAGSMPVECEVRDVDRAHVPNRPVAICRAGAVDLSQAMVVQGWARPYTAYMQDYAQAGAIARALQRGFWAGTFGDPADFRHKR